MFSFSDANGYDANDDSGITEVDDAPDQSFYGPKIPRSKRVLKKDGAVVDTNFLAWLVTMREMNANSDEEWEWNGEG